MAHRLDFVQTVRHGSMDTQLQKEEIVQLHPTLYQHKGDENSSIVQGSNSMNGPLVAGPVNLISTTLED